MKKHDAYEKACLDLVECFKTSTEILIIDPDRFRMLMLLLKSPTQLDWNITVQPFTIIDAKLLIPDITYQIDPNGVPQYFNSVAATSLVKEYGQAWMPTNSEDFRDTLQMNIITHPSLCHWRRGVRALKSTDKNELAILTIDPCPHIRGIANKRILEEIHG